MWATKDFRGILGDVRATHLIGGIWAAAMEAERAEHNYAARGHNRRNPGRLSKVAGLVAGSLIAHMLDQSANADVRKGHHVRSAIGEGHVIHRCPAGDVRRVREPEVAAILMPRKRHALFGGFDDVLIVKEKRRVAESRAADLGHQFAEYKLAQPRRAIVLLGDVIAFAAMADVDVVGTQSIHLRVHRLNQMIARLAQYLQLLLRYGAFEDKISLLTKLRPLFLGDNRHTTTGGGQTGKKSLETIENIGFWLF